MELTTQLKKRIVSLTTLVALLVLVSVLAGYISEDIRRQRALSAQQGAVIAAEKLRLQRLEARLVQQQMAEQNSKLRAALRQRLQDMENQTLSADDQRQAGQIRDMLSAPAGGAGQNERLRVALGQVLATAELREARATYASIEREVAAVRGISFQTPVVYETMKVSDFPGFVRQQIRQEHTEEEFRNYSRALAVLGLLPEGTDLEQLLLSVLGEQVGAFYDEERQRLVTFSDRPSTIGMDTMILAHELTHALDDQHFQIKKLGIHLKDNDDRALAALSLIEGNATMVMGLVYLQHAGHSSLASALEDFGVMFRQNAEQFNRAPPFVQQSLIFPYLEGQQFVLALMARGGEDAVNDAYRHPPSSTTQILHPEKYFERHDPSEIPLPDFAQQKSWKLLSRNVVGEFGIQILLGLQLDVATAHRAAAGWDGDRYAVYEIAPHQLAMLWISAWESDVDAQEFADALTAWAQKSGRNLRISRRKGAPYRVLVSSSDSMPFPPQ